MSHTDPGGVAATNGMAESNSESNSQGQPSLSAPQSHLQMLSARQNLAGHSLGRPWRLRGRAIKRLITLQDNISDLIDEAVRRATSRRSVGQPSAEQNRLFKNYELLIARVPELQTWITNPHNVETVDTVIKELTSGADSARADDAANLKKSVVTWIAELNKDCIRLSPYDKSGRGFHHECTGRLLCPVEYDWNDMEHRAKIRDWHPNFLVTANSWPTFLYKDNDYDESDPTKGLFKGTLLVRAFKHIFTSPSSADEDENTDVDRRVGPKRRHGERRTRNHVAHLLKMKSVEPRAIAYVAVQLRFALSDCGAWRNTDCLFNHVDFYNSIARWFEEVDDAEDKAFVEDLLLWWNREVFGVEAVTAYAPQDASKMSVATSFKRRRTGGSTV
ncbi:hypothetical protein EV363DRAFT_1457848 [Boletus edulis]|nr:hypothetical protein EV363DRAFT_1457848 [Boletus edulis]